MPAPLVPNPIRPGMNLESLQKFCEQVQGILAQHGLSGADQLLGDRLAAIERSVGLLKAGVFEDRSTGMGAATLRVPEEYTQRLPRNHISLGDVQTVDGNQSQAALIVDGTHIVNGTSVVTP